MATYYSNPRDIFVCFGTVSELECSEAFATFSRYFYPELKFRHIIMLLWLQLYEENYEYCSLSLKTKACKL